MIRQTIIRNLGANLSKRRQAYERMMESRVEILGRFHWGNGFHCYSFRFTDERRKGGNRPPYYVSLVPTKIPGKQIAMPGFPGWHKWSDIGDYAEHPTAYSRAKRYSAARRAGLILLCPRCKIPMTKTNDYHTCTQCHGRFHD
jgi:hypothetical protein